MSNLFIDITELVQWQGRLTGVPRVMNELARRFSAEHKVNYFVKWDSPVHSYTMVQWPPVAESSGATAAGEPRSKYLESALFIAKKIKHSSPMVDRTLGLLVHAARNMIVGRPEEPRGVVTPKANDTLLILADWHASDPDFVRHLMELTTSGVKLVIFAHDLLPIVAPQFSGHATEYVTRFATVIYPRASLIITNSHNTKNDVARWLEDNKLPKPPIKVARLGDDFHFAKPIRPLDEKFADTKLKGKDYFLCVGTIEIRKNHMLLYYVYKLARQRHIKLPKTLIVGRRGWQTEAIIELITKDPEINDDLVVLENISDGELSWLYENSLATIYPSFYEGWGLPIAESVARGVPCLCSNTSSMPEIAGGLVGYFNPSSPDECLAAILKLMHNKNLRAAKEKLKQYRPTSWDQTYQKVAKVIEDLA